MKKLILAVFFLLSSLAFSYNVFIDELICTQYDTTLSPLDENTIRATQHSPSPFIMPGRIGCHSSIDEMGEAAMRILYAEATGDKISCRPDHPFYIVLRVYQDLGWFGPKRVFYILMLLSEKDAKDENMCGTGVTIYGYLNNPSPDIFDKPIKREELMWASANVNVYKNGKLITDFKKDTTFGDLLLEYSIDAFQTWKKLYPRYPFPVVRY